MRRHRFLLIENSPGDERGSHPYRISPKSDDGPDPAGFQGTSRSADFKHGFIYEIIFGSVIIDLICTGELRMTTFYKNIN